jgi:hypothetical protein
MDQGIVRLTLRVLGLVKTILLKTFIDCFFFFFYLGITLVVHPMAWWGASVGFLNPAASMEASCALWVVAAWEH